MGTAAPPTYSPPPSSSTRSGLPAVVVTALSQDARAWWERLGFHPFEPDDPDRLDLYLLTSEIAASLKRAR